MGVMMCSRKGCDDIMCETYIDDIGYICSGCIFEFKTLMGETPHKREEITNRLTVFMETKKSKFDSDDSPIDVETFFEEFRNGY